MAELNKLTIAAAREGLRKREFTAVELTEACSAAAAAAAPLNAWTVLTAESALAQAAKVLLPSNLAIMPSFLLMSLVFQSQISTRRIAFLHL